MSDALRHLQALYAAAPPGYSFTVTGFPPKGEQPPEGLPERKAVRWARADDLAAAVAHAAALSADNFNVYVSMGLVDDIGRRQSERRGGRIKSHEAGAVVGAYAEIDLAGLHPSADPLPPDAEAAWAALAAAGLPRASLAVHSGGGLHLYWLFPEPFIIETPEERARLAKIVYGVQQAIKRAFAPHGWKLDSTFDLARVLRLAGTVNLNTPTPTTARILWSDGPRYTTEDLEPFAEPVPAPARPMRRRQATGARKPDSGRADAPAALDAPPVRLSAEGLAVWRGERPVLKSDGVIDRSKTHWKIGMVLWHANASPAAIAAALEERDAALGYGKAAGRNDGGKWFDDIAQRIDAKARAELAEAVPAPPADAAAMAEEGAALRAEVVRLESRVERYRTAYDSMRCIAQRRLRGLLAAEAREREVRAIAAHPYYQGRVGPVLGLAKALAAAGDADRRPDGHTLVEVWKVAKDAGCSPDQVSDAVASIGRGNRTIKGCGAIATDYEWRTVRNPATGKDEPRRALLVKLDLPREKAGDEADILAYLDRRAPRRRRESQQGNRHGGARVPVQAAMRLDPAPVPDPAPPAAIPPTPPATEVIDDVRDLPAAAAWIIGAAVLTPDGAGTVAMVETSYRLAVALETGARRWYALDEVRWGEDDSPSGLSGVGSDRQVAATTERKVLPPQDAAMGEYGDQYGALSAGGG